MEFGISALLGPKVERDRGQFVYHRLGQAVFRQIDGLNVGPAGVATLNPDVGKCFGSIDRELSMVFLAAAGTDDAPELPFGKAEAAEQTAAASIALRAKDRQHRLTITEGAKRIGVTLKLQPSTPAGELGVRLQEGQGKEFFRLGRRLIGTGPASVEQIGPPIRGGGLQIASNLREKGGGFFPDQLKKLRKSGESFGRVQGVCCVSTSLAGQRAGRPLDSRRDAGATLWRDVADTLVETFLKACCVDIEAENLGREGVLGGKEFRAPDSLLPGGRGHRAIMGLRPSAGNL
jgi:hypothetical protein